jgi:D-alanyl-D-alanine dipeptidase
MRYWLVIISSCLLLACTERKEIENQEVLLEDSVQKAVVDSLEKPLKIVEPDDTSFSNLADYTSEIKLDMRYASDNNFLKEQVYECPNCFLRYTVIQALVKANDRFISEGFRLRLFDCYRPRDVQFKMWGILPDGRYVANPQRGSVHNRGGAVDVTLENLDGEILDMGTEFDHFGKEAHHGYSELSDTITANREYLASTLEEFGFSRIRTEWWHYNFGTAKQYQLSNFPISCD